MTSGGMNAPGDTRRPIQYREFPKKYPESRKKYCDIIATRLSELIFFAPASCHCFTDGTPNSGALHVACSVSAGPRF